MIKRTIVSSLIVGFAFGSFVFGGLSSDAEAKSRFISIGTGGPTGVYFVVGNAVCRMVHREAAEGRKKAVNTVFVVPLRRRVALTIISVKLKKVSYSLVLHSLTGSTTPITAVPNGKVSSTVNYVLSFRFTRSRFNLLLARVQV